MKVTILFTLFFSQLLEVKAAVKEKYLLNESHDLVIVPLSSPLAFPAGEWSMNAIITER